MPISPRELEEEVKAYIGPTVEKAVKYIDAQLKKVATENGYNGYILICDVPEEFTRAHVFKEIKLLYEEAGWDLLIKRVGGELQMAFSAKPQKKN